MNKQVRNFRYAVTAFLFLCCGYPASATHLAGQDFTYTFVDSSAGLYHYRVTLVIYQDCLNAMSGANEAENPAYLAVYNGAGALVQLDTNIYYSSADTMPVTATGTCGRAGATPPVCRRKVTFIKDYYLPPSASGYNISYQRCCLNDLSNIVNSLNVGMSCWCSIPPFGTAPYNNSAVFKNYPPLILALNDRLSFDCSATDADGDSLSYQFCTAYAGDWTVPNVKPIPVAPPFAPEDYIVPLSYSNPVSYSVALTIDPVTGMMTGTPNATGTYLVTVCCNEWRHGVLVNTVQREFEFTVAGCGLGVASLRPGMFDIYPNPASSVLTIVAADKITLATITNLIGQTVVTDTYNSEQVEINVAGLLPGIYFVKINEGEIKKFVKD